MWRRLYPPWLRRPPRLAERNIDDYLDDLRHEFNGQRQSEITSELLDIVAGSEALIGGETTEEYGLRFAE